MIQTPTTLNSVQQLNDDMATIVETVCDSLVQIQGDEGSVGAGTIWHPDGLIVTNAHVVIDHRNGHRRTVQVTLSNGDTYPAQLVAYDRNLDLAALAIDATDLPTIEPGDSRSLRPGQWVMALGHPWGMLNALTSGVVIGAHVHLPEIHDHREWVALSLKLRPGHSGGPLVDADGKLVGINTMITGPVTGFAIPVQTVKRWLKAVLGSPPPAPDEVETPTEIMTV